MQPNQSKFSVYPSVGQTVNVMHRSTTGKNGLVKLESASKEARRIKQVHIITSGYPTITDHAGDTWSVKPSKMGEWDTTIPQAEA